MKMIRMTIKKKLEIKQAKKNNKITIKLERSSWREVQVGNIKNAKPNLTGTVNNITVDGELFSIQQHQEVQKVEGRG